MQPADPGTARRHSPRAGHTHRDLVVAAAPATGHADGPTVFTGDLVESQPILISTPISDPGDLPATLDRAVIGGPGRQLRPKQLRSSTQFVRRQRAWLRTREPPASWKRQLLCRKR